VILSRNTNPNLRVFVVWEPILWGDWHRPLSRTLARISDSRAAQFWDPNHLVSQELKRAIQTGSPLPKSKCCVAFGFYWDMAAIFPADAHARAALPEPVFFDGEVVPRAAAIESELKELISAAPR
jgi:hypothetical protein